MTRPSPLTEPTWMTCLMRHGQQRKLGQVTIGSAGAAETDQFSVKVVLKLSLALHLASHLVRLMTGNIYKSEPLIFAEKLLKTKLLLRMN